jgi:uncharacterized protein (DUF1501 family)
VITRRDFLSSSALVALAPTVPAFLARTARAAAPKRDTRVLVVIQLDGGNDGINTVVPFRDEGYARHRSTLRIPTTQLVKVNDAVGLHPAMGEMGKLLDAGQLAVVQGVGYPNPNRSHFESMAIWHAARLKKDDRPDLGWLGRAYDDPGAAPNAAPALIYVGPGEVPVAVRGRRSVASALTRAEDYTSDPSADGRRLIGQSEPRGELAAFVRRQALDGYATADRMAEVLKGEKDSPAYPATELAGHVRLIARLVKMGAGARVYYARQGGYDTHAVQLGAHSELLSALSGALSAFLKDLSTAKLADRVAVVCFSEFGRTVRENGSAGTDHGTAGPVFLLGEKVKGGLVGETPSLADLDPVHGDVKVGIDFRRVYATVLEKWLGLTAKGILAGEFETLPLFAVR